MIRPLVGPSDLPPDEARSLLRRELLRPEYHERDLVGRTLRWIERTMNRLLDAASGVPPLSAFVAMVVGLVLVLVLGWLLSRVRGARRAPAPGGAVLTGERVAADELRARALAALADERPAEALLQAFRAVAVRQVELGRIDDQPGATAHELAAALSGVHPAQAERVAEAARLFDLVCYGHRPASPQQARAVLDLDDRLAGVRA